MKGERVYLCEFYAQFCLSLRFICDLVANDIVKFSCQILLMLCFDWCLISAGLISIGLYALTWPSIAQHIQHKKSQ